MGSNLLKYPEQFSMLLQLPRKVLGSMTCLLPLQLLELVQARLQVLLLDTQLALLLLGWEVGLL